MRNEKAISANNRRILVVDDNEDALLVMRMLLEAKGYTVQTCPSGLLALQWLEAAHFDVILLDISMPEMDGYETCRRIRQQPRDAELVIIALTGYGQAEDMQRTREAGFDSHLLKPVDLTALTSLLDGMSPRLNQPE